MAIDKSRTPVWMKVVLIGIALTFVLGFCTMAGNPLNLFAPQQTATQTADPASAINQKHQGGVSQLTTLLQSNPESYTVLVDLGNSYFDWAAELQSAASTNTALQGADLPMWNAAKDAYSRALKVRGNEAPVRVDYAITLFYSGDTNAAVKIVTAVSKEQPTFAQAWFNLGVFDAALGTTETAISAFERYLQLDPNGQQGNAAYAKQALEQLKSGAATP